MDINPSSPLGRWRLRFSCHRFLLLHWEHYVPLKEFARINIQTKVKFEKIELIQTVPFIWSHDIRVYYIFINFSRVYNVCGVFHMLLCGSGIKVLFLRECVMYALKIPIHQERFYIIPVILIELKYLPCRVSKYSL